MSLSHRPTALPEVWVLGHAVHEDARGRFEELWRAEDYAALGVPPFVQDNASRSEAGVVRGLHYQWPRPQGKLVSVLAGAIWDVVVDVRRGSPRFARWVAVPLAAGGGQQLWVPPGFAHGFAVLEAPAIVHYKATTAWDPDAERALAWDDPDVGVAWPLSAPHLSQRDAGAPRLAALAARGALPGDP